MALCKYCDLPFQWAQSANGWMPLVPAGEDEDLIKEFIDADGVYRADHRLICTRPRALSSATSVVRAAKPLEPTNEHGTGESIPASTGVQEDSGVDRMGAGVLPLCSVPTSEVD